MAVRTDLRCEVGAYVCRGTALYRVAYCQLPDVVLEDAFQSNAHDCVTFAITVEQLDKHYKLVRGACQ